MNVADLQAAMREANAQSEGGGQRERKPPAKTLMGHPGFTARSAATRGEPPKRAASPPPSDDEGEATQAINVDDVLAQIDARTGGSGGAKKAASAHPPEDDEGATQAMNVEDMLSKIDERSAAADDDDDGDDKTQAMTIEDMRRQAAAAAGAAPEGDEDEDGEGATVAMNVADLPQAPPRREPAAAKPAAKPAATERAPAKPPTAAAPAEANGAPSADDLEPLPPAPSGDGPIGAVTYALAFEGRKDRIARGIAAADAALQADDGAHDPRELQRVRAHFEGERGALDAAAAQQGWIMLGGAFGGLTILLVVLGMVL